MQPPKGTLDFMIGCIDLREHLKIYRRMLKDSKRRERCIDADLMRG
jgi:hypothetical protein